MTLYRLGIIITQKLAQYLRDRFALGAFGVVKVGSGCANLKTVRRVKCSISLNVNRMAIRAIKIAMSIRSAMINLELGKPSLVPLK